MQRLRMILTALAALLVLAPMPAWAQNNFPTPGGAGANGAVLMCLNALGQAIPATSAGTCLGSGGGGGGNPTGFTNQVRGTTTATDTAAHSILPSAGGGLKNYVTDIECFRTDAGTSPIVLTFNDSASTPFVLPASSSNGSGVVKSFLTPLVTAAATAFTVTSGTAVTTLYCSAQAFTGT
jgi:hypothetical protein